MPVPPSFFRATRVAIFAVLGAASAFAVKFPELQTSDAVDTYFGEKVPDPFRWLEAFDSAEAREFIERENALTAKWIPSGPRDAYRERLEKLIDYPRRSVPSHYGTRWISLRNSGLQQHYVLTVQDGLDGEPRVLLDPNTFSKDGAVALAETEFTEDGSLLAYGKSVGGSDEQTVYVRDVAKGRDLPDVLEGMRFSSIAWAPDNSGFYYNKFPDPARRANSTIYWHALGAKQADDRALYALPERPEVDLSPGVTEDGKYLVIYESIGTDERNGIRLREIGADPGAKAPLKPLLPMGVASFWLVENDGPVFYVYTDKDAPRRRLIAVDARDPAEEKWREIIPESEDLLNDVTMVNGQFVASFTRDVHGMLKIFDRDGTFVREIALPTKGTVGEVSGRRGDTGMFFVFSSYTYPGTIFRYDFKTGKTSEYYRSKIDFDPADYETEQVFFASKDGTRVPMFVTSRKGIARDGSHPALLTAYGGFGISLDPGFDPMIIPWLERGGVYAVVNLRGGGEYGTEWHDAGKLANKQNSFDDFIAAAEKLIADRITSPGKLAIEGGSNGGLLVAAAMLQRPDLFGAIVSQVPVTDMLRFQKFGTGRYWTTEYGSADESAEAFRWLRKYSPLHNVKRGESYPPLLVTTADGDDRVVPLHAFKFIATMQSEAAPGVYLLRHELGAGHGGGKPLSKILDEEADVYAFLTRALGMEAVNGVSP